MLILTLILIFILILMLIPMLILTQILMLILILIPIANHAHRRMYPLMQTFFNRKKDTCNQMSFAVSCPSRNLYRA